MSDDCLPDCMMPDGGQCCAGYTKQRQRIEALETALREIEHISRTEVYNTNARLLRVCIDARAALAPKTEK